MTRQRPTSTCGRKPWLASRSYFSVPARSITWPAASPASYGSAVIVIPGSPERMYTFREMHAWLKRMGYKPYFSGIGLNAECPNLLIRKKLSETLERARRETGRKVHLIGHSLGGIIARSMAGESGPEISGPSSHWDLRSVALWFIPALKGRQHDSRPDPQRAREQCASRLLHRPLYLRFSSTAA